MTIEREKALLARKLMAQPFVETLTGNLAQMNVLDLAEYLLANFIFKAAAPDDLQKNLEAWWIECNGTGIDACSTCRPPQVCAWHLARLDDLKDLLANYTPKPAVPEDGELRSVIEDPFYAKATMVTGQANNGLDAWVITKKDFNAYIDQIMQLFASQAAAAQERTELETLRRIENMGVGEAKRQGMYTAHNMDGYHRAYGEAVSHNIHERISALAAQPKEQQGEGESNGQ